MRDRSICQHRKCPLQIIRNRDLVVLLRAAHRCDVEPRGARNRHVVRRIGLTGLVRFQYQLEIKALRRLRAPQTIARIMNACVASVNGAPE